jgi:protoheme ferro-lyase
MFKNSMPVLLFGAMFGNFIAKQLMARQLKNLPADQQQKVLEIFEKNPEFFTGLAEKIQTRVAKGESQMAAVMAVVSEHKAELEKLMGS